MLSRIANSCLAGVVLFIALAGVFPARAAAYAPESEGTSAEAGENPGDLDNSHKNATAALDKPEEVRFDLSIYTFVVFALLMLLLGKFAWGPIASGLDQREASIAKMIDDAKQASESAQKSLQQYEARLSAAQEEAGRIVSEARRQADEVAAKIQSEAEAAAQRERDRAVAEIRQAKNAALQEIAAKSVTAAVDLAGKIIRREVREADHQQLIRESLERFSSN